MNVTTEVPWLLHKRSFVSSPVLKGAATPFILFQAKF